MFTGLVETLGTIRAAEGSSPRRLTVASQLPTAEIAIGDSVAIDGCCLTVVEKTADTLTFEAATETLRVTTLGNLRSGDKVHLERALRVGDRLGGHIVAGHVDGIGILKSREQKDSALYLGIDAPPEVARLTADRGSITIAGVSLTVTGVEGDRFFVGLIPHTVDVTHLGRAAIGTPLNLEADLIARYVERLMAYDGAAKAPGLTEKILKDKGFT